MLFQDVGDNAPKLVIVNVSEVGFGNVHLVGNLNLYSIFIFHDGSITEDVNLSRLLFGVFENFQAAGAIHHFNLSAHPFAIGVVSADSSLSIGEVDGFLFDFLHGTKPPTGSRRW
jgi:hypothetical protein